MKIPFDNTTGDLFASIQIDVGGSSLGDATIKVVSEGAGAFIEITSVDGLRLNAEELVTLSEWATEACEELDKFNGERHE
jgi:hypothetical protein